MSRQEELYFSVKKETVQNTLDTMQQIARMGYARLLLLKAVYPDIWTDGYEQELYRLWDMSREICSWREAKLGRVEEAERILQLYGGSGKKKTQGKVVLARMREHVNQERR